MPCMVRPILTELILLRRQSAPDLVDYRYASQFFNYQPEPDLTYKSPPPWDKLAPNRLKTIKNLFSVAEQSLPGIDRDKAAVTFERLYFRELERSSPYAVTIGLEVEIEEQSLIRAIDAEHPDDAQERADLAYAKQARLRLAHAAGMNSPKESSPEVIWEFASQPASYYETLAREVQVLMAMDTVSPNYQEHPLHITIGGITA